MLTCFSFLYSAFIYLKQDTSNVYLSLIYKSKQTLMVNTSPSSYGILELSTNGLRACRSKLALAPVISAAHVSL